MVVLAPPGARRPNRPIVYTPAGLPRPAAGLWFSRGGGRCSEVTRSIVWDIVSWSENWGVGALELLRRWSKNFLIGPPITLKFGAEKLERESQERESESESEREQVVVFTFASCCCSTLVS